MMKKVGYLALSIVILMTIGLVASAATEVPESVNKVAKEKGIDSKEIKNVSNGQIFCIIMQFSKQVESLFFSQVIYKRMVKHIN